MQKGPAIAIVEDDRFLREELACFFEAHQYQVHEANCMEGLFDILREYTLNLAILDLNLPGQSGFEIARNLRERIPDIGIIMLTARTRIDDRVKGYDVGADIYLTKPTAPRELLAAVTRLSRRNAELMDSQWVLDVRQFELMHKQLGLRIQLTAAETAILRSLALESTGILGLTDLLEQLKAQFPDRANTQRSIENTISRLRKKIADQVGDVEPKSLLRAHRNLGYQLAAKIKIIESK